MEELLIDKSIDINKIYCSVNGKIAVSSDNGLTLSDYISGNNI
jgi:hypothetical protein